MAITRRVIWFTGLVVLSVGIVSCGGKDSNPDSEGSTSPSTTAPVSAPSTPEQAADTTTPRSTTTSDGLNREPLEYQLGEGVEVVLSTLGRDGVLSPDGSMLIVVRKDPALEQRFASLLCVIEVDTAEEWCLQVVLGPMQGSWSPDGQLFTYSFGANADIMLLNIAERTLVNLTEDDVWDSGNTSTVPIDSWPVFSADSGSIIFLRSDVSREGFQIGRIDLGSLEIRLVNGPIKEVVVGGTTKLRPRLFFEWFPLVRKDGTALVSGDGAVFSVDFDAGSVTELFDYSSEYDPGFPEAKGTPRLSPIYEDELGIWLGEPFLLGEWAYPSGSHAPGLYIFGEAGLVPQLPWAPNDLSSVGPFLVSVSDDGQRVIVAWFDEERVEASSRSHLALVVSVVDSQNLQSTSLRDATELFSPNRYLVNEAVRLAGLSWSNRYLVGGRDGLDDIAIVLGIP